ncbi:hypothetical protein GE09DRAFT_1287117 [Coniochaeta sp. 2T2.1]|nr:hypothetical protein GE09DRAFT_1287117 [Coniochaeta sp. 2T2.1]
MSRLTRNTRTLPRKPPNNTQITSLNYQLHYSTVQNPTMANSTAQALASLSSLPPEVRRQIWNHIAETHDLTPLLATSRWTRQDIKSRLPGEIPTCAGPRCWYPFKTCARPVDEIRVVVEPWRSDHSWLKLVLRRHKSESVWTIRQIDETFLTSQLRNYPARRVVVEFRPPAQRRGFRHAAFLTLRAKLYDVCVLLGRVRLTGQTTPELEIVFRDAPAEVRACWRQSFWEDSPSMILARRRGFGGVPKGELSRYRWFKECPFYYECLMLPLLLHPLMRNAAVRFDGGREPDRRSASSAAAFINGTAPGQRLVGPGYKALSLLNWDYCQDLMRDCYMADQARPCDMTVEGVVQEYASLVTTTLQNFHTDINELLDIISGAEAASGPPRAAVARLAPADKGAFGSSYRRPPVVWSKDCVLEYRYSISGRVPYDRGEGRGKWRWTSAGAKETYRLWAEGKKEDDSARWRRQGEWRWAPVPQPNTPDESDGESDEESDEESNEESDEESNEESDEESD